MKLNKKLYSGLIVGAFAFGATLAHADANSYAEANSALSTTYKNLRAQLTNEERLTLNDKVKALEDAWIAVKEQSCGGDIDKIANPTEAQYDCNENQTWAQNDVLESIRDNHF